MNNLTGDHYMGKKEINLKEYFELVKRRFWIIALITIITTVAGYYYSNLNNIPLYQTSTRIIIGSDKADMQTRMVMIKDPIIMEKVRTELKLSRSAEAIASQVDVARLDESQVIRISVIDQDPKVAVAIANETAALFKVEAGTLLAFNDVQLLSKAKENTAPINGRQNKLIVIAFVFGLFSGIGLIFLLDSLDGSVRKEKEVEAYLGVPVLGVISNMNKRKFVAKRNKNTESGLRSEKIASKKKKTIETI